MGKHYPGQESSADQWNQADEILPEDLQQIAQWYATQPVPEPTPEFTQRLMTRLQTEEVAVARVSFQSRQSIIQTLRMARWQLALLGPWFWITGAVLLVLGLGAAPFLPQSEAITLLIYALPLTAVLSAVYALRRVTPGLRDLEKSSPTGFIEMMTGVVLALVCFDVALGVLATVALSLVHWAAFGSLLVSWLGPLLLLVAISLPVALRWGAFPAMLVGGGPWLVLMLFAAARSGTVSATFLLADQLNGLLGLQLCAVGLGAVTLFLLLTRGSTWQRTLVLA
jgi:hypothetical protein